MTVRRVNYNIPGKRMEKLVHKRGTTLYVRIPKEVDHSYTEELREF